MRGSDTLWEGEETSYFHVQSVGWTVSSGPLLLAMGSSLAVCLGLGLGLDGSALLYWISWVWVR